MYETKPYFYGTGRRKNSVARVRVYTGTGFQLVQFIPSQEDYFFRGGFQFRFERIVCNVLMMSFLEAPAQEPFEESHLLADGAVSHILGVTQEVDVFVQSKLVEIVERV